MALSSDNASSIVQQHCNGDSLRENHKTLYTDILLSRMISAANSAAALAASTNKPIISPLSNSSLTMGAPNKRESDDFEKSSKSLDVKDNTKTNKKLSFSVDSLLTSKKSKTSLIYQGIANLNSTVATTKSQELLGKQQAEEEEDLEVDGEENDESNDADSADANEEDITINEEFEDDLRQNVRTNSYGTISSDERRSSGIVVPRPVIPTSPLLQNMNPSSNLIAGIAQAMAAAAASAAAANSRYNPLSQTTSLYNKPNVSESVTTAANSILRANAGLTSPHIPPGFPLGSMGTRPSFLGKYIKTNSHYTSSFTLPYQ